jgi:hypothetical protein
MFLITSLAWAQSSTTGAIAGTVRDTSGAVLPGVTVEAASPALIEKARTATTDGQGNYKITDLRPGTYSITFTLAGFSTFKREGIELNVGVTVPANADLKVGSLEETVTVSGATPVVDVQNVRTQQVLTSEVLQALPSGMKDLTAFINLTLGATTDSARNDVGGNQAELSTGIVLHGGRGDDGRTSYDGMSTNVFYGNGGGKERIYKFNTMAVQETVVDTGGTSAEGETGGANVNMVPKDGGNRVTLNSVVNYTNKSLSSGQVPDSLIARGSAPNQNSMKKVYDYGFGVGGPILKDKLWFFSANRWWGNQSYATNNYFNSSTDWRFYAPDLNAPAYSDQHYRDNTGRVTLQATAKHKFTALVGEQYACACWMGISGASAPEATTSFIYGPEWLAQGSWSYTASSKLLVQAGASFLKQAVQFQGFLSPTNLVGPSAQQVSILEQTGFGATPAGYRYNALAGSSQNDYGQPQNNNNFNERVSVSYVTGSHAVKVGVQTLQGNYETHGNTKPNGLNYTFSRGVPISLTEFATPFSNANRLRSVGVYGQDQWTLKRLTLNLGVRYDNFRAFTLPISLPAGPFVSARSYAGVQDIPNYKDITPRLGASYDVFGNGKTAIKGSWGRYLMGQGGGNTTTVAPATAVVNSTTRTWNDVNGNYVPDCNLTNPLANGECGQINNLAFGQPAPNLVWDPGSRIGWNIREFNYATSVAVQQQLRPGLGVSVGYYRTDWRNQLATVNTAVSPSDYTQYCVTAPVDNLLGGVSGKQVCGLYDVNPNQFGRVSNVLMLAKNVPGANGIPKEIYNGVDITTNVRFGKGGLVMGGIALGRTNFDYCSENSLPNVSQQNVPAGLPRAAGFCNIQSPLWSGVGSQAKLQVVYPLPWSLSVSGTFKDLPGVPTPATLNATNAQIAPSLGRSLSACPAVGTCTLTSAVLLLPSTSYQGDAAAVRFDDRLNETDLRVTRMFKVQSGRVQASIELYNVFNERPAQGVISTYGATWLRPSLILGGRLLKFGAQIDF